MRIGIDCRMMGLRHAGIGRYVQSLVEQLIQLDEQNEYVLFVRPCEESDSAYLDGLCQRRSTGRLDPRIKVVETAIPHYSLQEQIKLPGLIEKQRLDLMHFPHLNVPVLFRGPYVVTIHDLIKHYSRGRETTTRKTAIYWLKYLGYRLVFWLSVLKAKKIIVPSLAVKNELVAFYRLNPDKICVTYEAVNAILGSDERLEAATIRSVLGKFEIEKPYLLYVGSVYPHKNIDRLIEAVKILNAELALGLVIVCARSVFWERLAKKVVAAKVEKLVKLAGFVPDEELAVLYSQAEAFVLPTLMEGFGLPGLEAMAAGCPVVCSDIPVLRETYGEAAVYFDPREVFEMARLVKTVVRDRSLRRDLVERGRRQVKEYSWAKMAQETRAVYHESCLSL